jgi:hypothetical protein
MSHGSITLQIMNSYDSLLMAKFRIGNVSQFSPKSDAHYRVDPTGFAVVTSLESGCKFKSGYHVSKVLTPLCEWWHEPGGGNFGKRIVHTDNACPHKATRSQECMAHNEMVITADPSYSQDLAPSDLYLFGHIKGSLRRGSFETGER